VEDTTHLRARTYVAIGDSFTEGLADARSDGTFRGWADLVAHRLAAAEPESGPGPEHRPDFRYANLAVRGKLMGQILADQLPAAVAMGADLASIAGGLNDVMRPGCDIDAVCADLESAATQLARAGGRVVMFRSMDFTRRMSSSRRIAPKVRRLIDVVDLMAEKYGIVAVDLTSARVFDDPRLWAADRIHLTAEGHRRVAEAVLEALGHPAAFDWRAPLPAARPRGAVARRWADLVWFATFLAPWIKRRLTGRSSGDGVTAKRPELAPLISE
jgi:lysophospholipase L1-like esterase